jgi:hypothetical protein
VDGNKWRWMQFQGRNIRPLPPKHECLSVLKDFFVHYNNYFPLYHEPTFMRLVDRHYSRDSYAGVEWWASLNVALAIGHRLRVVSGLAPLDEGQKAWDYLMNAMGTFTELAMRKADLLSVQALLGMALFLWGTPSPQPTSSLVTTAVRLSHCIGLHNRGSDWNLSQVESEQRTRVFWIGYMLDRDIAFRSGQPPTQNDDDIDVELPSAEPEDDVGNVSLADGKGKVNIFRCACEFATIEGKAYKQLLSPRAAKQSDCELISTIGELDRQLEEWKDSIPVDLRPEHEIKASHTPLIQYIVAIHFAYYNCLASIHRRAIYHGCWTSRNVIALNPRIFSSAALCVSAARASIDLIKHIPQDNFTCVW